MRTEHWLIILGVLTSTIATILRLLDLVSVDHLNMTITNSTIMLCSSIIIQELRKEKQ